MSMISNIQGGATDEAQPLATVLRQTLVLAYKLKHDALKSWVEGELNGYPHDAELPDYRQFRCQSFAYLRSPYSGLMPNAGVIKSGQPDAVRDYLDRPVRFREGVAALGAMIEGDKDIQELWPTDLALGYASRGYDGFEALRAWKIVPRSHIVGLRDAVRNRLLQFVLELEDAAPEVGDDAKVPSVASSVVTQVFNTYIIGDHNSVHGAASAVTAPLHVPPGDDAALAAALERMGVPAAKAAEVVALAKEDRPDPKSGALGQRVTTWLSAAASGGFEIAKGVTTEMLVSVLKGYWGLGT